jgi:hypothetical protein
MPPPRALSSEDLATADLSHIADVCFMPTPELQPRFLA